jgi:hypothetical protein
MFSIWTEKRIDTIRNTSKQHGDEYLLEPASLCFNPIKIVNEKSDDDLEPVAAERMRK